MTVFYPLSPLQAKPDRCPASLWRDFWPLLTTPGTEETLWHWSRSGWLDLILPEWQRQRGPLNTQHQTHDFTLDHHSLLVVAKTKHSPYYGLLSPEEQKLAALAALFHDIAKNGGRAQQRFQLIPDWHHPTKAMMVAWRRLFTWGLGYAEVERVCRLVKHHQLFGRMIMRYSTRPEGPPEAVFQDAVVAVGCPSVLRMLLPLTEGDIRAVKDRDTLFTPLVAECLEVYRQQVGVRLAEQVARRKEAIVPLDWEVQQGWMATEAVRQAMDGCACGWPLQADDSRYPVWLEKPPGEVLQVEVLPEHVVGWDAASAALIASNVFLLGLLQ